MKTKNVYYELLTALNTHGKTISDIEFVVLSMYRGDGTSAVKYAGEQPSKADLFLNLNVEYKVCASTLLVFGYVGFKDGSWMNRSKDYNNVEWWQHQIAPDYEAAKLLCGIFD